MDPQLQRVGIERPMSFTLAEVRGLNLLTNVEYGEVNDESRQGILNLDGRSIPFPFKIQGNAFTINQNTAGIIASVSGQIPLWNQYLIHRERYEYRRDLVTRRVGTLAAVESFGHGWRASTIPFNFLAGENIALVCLFADLQTFPNRYSNYLGNSDHGVGVFGDEQQELVEEIYTRCTGVNAEHFMRADPLQLEATRSHTQKLFLIHIICCVLFKNFGQNNDHLVQFIERRISAFSSAAAAFDVTIENWRDLINPICIPQIGKTLATYPKLRAELVCSVMEDPDPLFSHTKMMMNYVGLTSVHCIDNFLRVTDKTVAHVHVKIIRESLTFILAMDELLEIWGDSFPYLRLLSPQTTAMDAVHWPNLAFAAYLHSIHVFGGTMANYQMSVNRVSMTNLPQLLARPLRADMIAVQEELLDYANLVRGNLDRIRDRLGIVPEGLDANLFRQLMDIQPNEEELEGYRRLDRYYRHRRNNDQVAPAPPAPRAD